MKAKKIAFISLFVLFILLLCACPVMAEQDGSCEEPELFTFSGQFDLLSQGGYGTLPEATVMPDMQSVPRTTAVQSGRLSLEDYVLRTIQECNITTIDSSTGPSYAIEIPLKPAGYLIESPNRSVEELYSFVQNFIQPLLNSRADLFYLDGGYTCSYTNDYYLYCVYLLTSRSRSEILHDLAEYRTLFGELTALARPEWSDLEYALFYHDLICSFYEYDHIGLRNNDPIYDAYTMLKTGRGVCQAYTLLYSALLRYGDIETVEALSPVINHTWNLVNLDGKWYHVDCTWDDPNEERSGRVYHLNFLRSDSGIVDPSRPAGCWVYNDAVEHTTSDTYDNWPWQASGRPVHFYKGKFYYMDDNDCTVCSYDPSNRRIAVIRELDDFIICHDQMVGYRGSFYGFAGYGNLLFFGNQIRAAYTLTGTNQFISYNIDTGEFTVIDSFDGASGTCDYYAGARVWGTRLEYGISDGPNATEQTVWQSTVLNKYVPATVRSMDTDGNGSINNADITLLIRYLSGWHERRFYDYNADIDKNGIINNRDAIALIRYVARH